MGILSTDNKVIFLKILLTSKDLVIVLNRNKSIY
jgi:hypothetical protein